MSYPAKLIFSIAVVLTLSVLSNAHADEAAEKGRKILDKNRKAVVSVEFVIKQKISFQGRPGQNSETKVEATGTVIGPDGLTIVSLSKTDPLSVLEGMMGDMGGMGQLNMDVEVRDVTILLYDGKEIPAEIILRDKDLDMAFVRPTEKSDSKFAYIDMSKDTEPNVLDQVIALNRLGKVANREHSASIERIEAIIRKPRKFYVPGNDPTNSGLGSPVFTLEGDVVGVLLMRTVRAAQGAGGLGMLFGFGGTPDNILAVIMPAEDIHEASQQAPPYE